jgi:hypothetical protein
VPLKEDAAIKLEDLFSDPRDTKFSSKKAVENDLLARK